MRLHLCAVGRLRAGPKRDLIDDYLNRTERTGRGLGLGPVAEHQVEAKKGGMAEEATLLARHLPQGGKLCVLDERGRAMTSPDFARTLARWRDDGVGDAAFVIGGADGVAPEMRERADLVMSFGAMVWPHMLVRVMLAEQLYRATSILAGAPYHRV